MKVILDNIRKFRMKKGLSQEYIAAKLEMHYTNYGHIESGRTKLSVDKLYKIAEVLEVSPLELQMEKTPATGDFHTFLSSPSDWLKKSKELEHAADQGAKCREELSAAQKKIIELQARLLEVFDRK